jgi:urease accessory protein
MQTRLLHLCDSLFPIGGFAFSEGLEAATARHLVRDAVELGAWLDTVLDESVGRCEGPAVALAWNAFESERWERLAILDQEVIALRAASAVRASTTAAGARLIKTWHALYPEARLAQVLTMVDSGLLRPALPVAFGAACASMGNARSGHRDRIDACAAVEAFAYTRLAATISSAMRLIAIGHLDAHRLLARALDRVSAIAVLALERDVESFAPAMDIAQMTHQYVHSRLFRS